MNGLVVRSALLSGVLALTLAPVAQAISPGNQTAVDDGVAFLKTKQVASGQIGTSASETGWSAAALSAAGLDLGDVATVGGTDLRAYLAANAPGATAVATDWERSIIAITADGQNPYSFGGVDYVAKLKTFVSAGQIGSATAINDDIFGLIALLAARVQISDPLLPSTVNYLLDQQKLDGGFSYSTDSAIGSDTNDTAAAIMALRAAEIAGLGGIDVTNALTDAEAYLLSTQNDDGGFPYDPLTPPDWGGPLSDVSSSAWAVMALTSVGAGTSTEADAAEAFIRGAQNPDGSFPYMAPAAGDVFNTAPAVTALSGSQYPVKVYAGLLPVAADITPVDQRDDSVATPSPSPTPTPGAVLGASTTPTPTPTPTPATAGGDVLGASSLPAVGEVSNVLLLELAVGISVMAGFAIYGLQRRRQLKD